MKDRVLITSVGRKVSLVKAFRYSFWHVIGQDIDHNAVAFGWCDEIGDKNTTCDLWIPTRDAEIKEAWEFNGWPTDCIDILQDKLKFYHWCKEHGFKSPEVYFVKPRVSQSGKETECIFQELLQGEEYSVDCFGNFKSEVISVVPRRRLKVLNGESCITITENQPEIVAQTISIFTSLKLVGHNVLQCFKIGSSVYWTDVNCRFGGASIVAISAGCKSPRWLLNLINGENVEPCIGKHNVGLIGKSYTEWSYE